MRNYFKILVMCLLFCFSSTACMQAKEASDLANKAPDFTLKDIKQETYSLSNYKDKKPVILFFWTTWCPFCRKELKFLNEKYSNLTKDNIELFSIDVGEDAYKVQNATERLNLTFRVLLDLDSNVAMSYDVMGVPTYILIDKKGNIVSTENSFPQNYKELILK